MVISICMTLMMPKVNTMPRARPRRTTEHGDHDGLDQELDEDLPTGGAEGLADPDLAHPLGERGEHDVGDDDAADQQRDDAAGEEGDVVDHALAVALLDPFLAVPDPEVIDPVADRSSCSSASRDSLWTSGDASRRLSSSMRSAPGAWWRFMYEVMGTTISRLSHSWAL